MNFIQGLTKLHINQQRQGPGSIDATLNAAKLTGVNAAAPIKIADIGCGTGAAAFDLVQYFINAHITAVDFLPPFLQVLNERARDNKIKHIDTLEASMTDLPFDHEEYDLIWSEGAIYNMGFREGVNKWRPFIKDKGHLVVSEITWLTDERPQAITDYWDEAYPQIATASGKIAQLEAAGYRVKGYFYLDEQCWLANYYGPLEQYYEKFLKDMGGHEELAQQIIDQDTQERELYEQYKDYVSYGVYVAQRFD